jgi:predicted CXXCH cytochrome family protein
MKSHVFRPLWVVLGFVALVLIVRFFYVPESFGIHERGYMYGWYRADDVDFWKDFPVKFQGSEYCKDCHSDKHELMFETSHGILQCENCHGPAVDHPVDPPKLTIDTSRELCLRCHTYLPYPTSARGTLRGIDPEKHNPDIECIMCHNPHKPGLEGLQ